MVHAENKGKIKAKPFVQENKLTQLRRERKAKAAGKASGLVRASGNLSANITATAQAPLVLKSKEPTVFTLPVITLILVAAVLIIFNQFQLSNAYAAASANTIGRSTFSGTADLSSVDVAGLLSTAQTLAAVFPELQGAKNSDAVMGILFPTGTPEYGSELGVSFDDPVGSLAKLAKMFKPLKSEVESSNPEAMKRFISLASQPKGVSCEYCCGVGPIGADRQGNSLCGCQHNPALLTIALYLTAYTDYSDAEILREIMRWKTLFFPQNMIELASKISGGDTTVLQKLPGMVGGC